MSYGRDGQFIAESVAIFLLGHPRYDGSGSPESVLDKCSSQTVAGDTLINLNEGQSCGNYLVGMCLFLAALVHISVSLGS